MMQITSHVPIGIICLFIDVATASFQFGKQNKKFCRNSMRIFTEQIVSYGKRERKNFCEAEKQSFSQESWQNNLET